MKLESFKPTPRILMGPGPSDVHPRILEALSRPTVGHLDPQFQELMSELMSMLRKVFRTDNKLTFPVSAPGSAGMETCFVNLVESGDKVIVCQNGVFGGRMRENVERCGGHPIIVDCTWGRAVDPDKVESALKQNRDAKIVAFVHAETSTGALSDAKVLTELAHQYNCLSIVDTVTSLSGSKLLVDGWELDAVYSGTQKCLSCVPGISPVTISELAQQKIKRRKQKVQSWFLDLGLVMAYWEENSKRTYHHTAPVNAMYALHESLLLVLEEGLENCWNRHLKLHHDLVTGLQAIGLEMYVPPNERVPQLNTVIVPDDIDESFVRSYLLKEYNLEIGAGLGPLAGKVWRIGLMGYSCNRKNIALCLHALNEAIEINRG
tara:strand:+ start:3519 stop:4649 length:1131 start_codon:yes stop_codon:yes gene_type:complete